MLFQETPSSHPHQHNTTPTEKVQPLTLGSDGSISLHSSHSLLHHEWWNSCKWPSSQGRRDNSHKAQALSLTNPSPLLPTRRQDQGQPPHWVQRWRCFIFRKHKSWTVLYQRSCKTLILNSSTSFCLSTPFALCLKMWQFKLLCKWMCLPVVGLLLGSLSCTRSLMEH